MCLRPSGKFIFPEYPSKTSWKTSPKAWAQASPQTSRRTASLQKEKFAQNFALQKPLGNNFGTVCTSCPLVPFRYYASIAAFNLGGSFFWVGGLPLNHCPKLWQEIITILINSLRATARNFRWFCVLKISRKERRFLAWPSLQSLTGEKRLYLCKFWAVKTFWKSAGETILSGLRGAKHFSVAFRIVFRIFFRVLQTVFRIDLKVFRGQFRSADMPP